MQQPYAGLPNDGVQYVLGLFIKSSSFTRYLLDDVLPKEVFNNRQIIEEDLDNLLEECEALMVSLKTLKQLSRFLNISEAGGTSSQNVQKKCINENAVVPVKLVESFQIMSSTFKLTKDIKQFQIYYCELCDDSSHKADKFKEHFASERHISALLSSSNSFLTYQCKSCGLFIMATQSLLNNIIEAEFHFRLDSAFENQNLNLVNKNINVSNKPEEFNSQLSKDTEDSIESLVSESTNRNDEAAEGGIIEERKIDENNLRTFYKYKWSMTDLFVEINNKMLSNEIKYCHYCRPCDQALMTAEDWFYHKQSQQHIKNIKYKNYQEKCFNCFFHIFGRKPELNAYLRYHKEVNHKKTNNSDQFESKKNIIINRKPERNKSIERNFNSSWKNNSYFNAKKSESAKNNLKQEQRNSDDLSNFEEQLIDETEILNETYEVGPCEKHEVIPPIKNYASLSLYRDIIALQKKHYIENNVNLPVGACLPCFDIIKNEYEWIVHIKKFHNVNNAFIEETCEKCQISIYGPADVITKEIWNIKEHLELDKLIN